MAQGQSSAGSAKREGEPMRKEVKIVLEHDEATGTTRVVAVDADDNKYPLVTASNTPILATTDS